MGGAVSSGRDNDELVDNLKNDDYIKTSEIERVFRIVDRSHYYLPEYKDSAYKDLAWKCGTLHLSAPCIYSAVMEALELERGMSFLNLGSGTGYLNTMVGYMIGPNGINHGIELHEDNVAYAGTKLESYMATSRKFDDMEFCEPQFVVGNCLDLAPDNRLYDRVYCGASCPEGQKELLQNMIKINGILVVPMGDQLLKIRRLSEIEFTSENVLPVSFASLIMPGPANKALDPISLPDVNPLSLQCFCRLAVRDSIRKNFDFELPPPREDSTKKTKKVKTRIFRRERGRYPLDILPTAQGLMIVGAFNQSDNEDDGDDEDEDEIYDHSFFDLQLQRHALELSRRVRRLNNAHRSLSTDDIDSDLSDLEESQGFSSSPPSHDLNGNDNSSVTASTQGQGPMETENVISVDEIVQNDPDENKGCKQSSSILETLITTGGTIGPTSSGLGQRTASLSSEEEEPVSALSSKSQAIDMNLVSGSQSLAIKSSYSTSADTSETSGFGSLGEDPPHIELPQSSIDDDRKDNLSGPFYSRSSSLSSKTAASTWLKGKENFSLPKALEEENEADAIEHDDSSDAGWMDIDDEDNDDDGYIDNHDDDEEEEEEISASKYMKRVIEGGMEEDEVEIPVLRGPDFSAFLKEKVETLPIPNSMKAFILYYR